MRIYLLILVLLLGATKVSKSQDIQETLNRVENQAQKGVQEKLYLHLDKYSYTAGESIFFKAYTTIGIHNLYSSFSGIAHIDLIDGTKKVIQTMTIPLVMGLGIGDIALTDTLTEGSYRLRAYTNWMRNFDDQYFYDRTIQITNGRSDNIQTATVVSAGEKENEYTITLSTLSGLPLNKTRVNYEIIANDKSISKKRQTTDEQGRLHIAVDKKHLDGSIKLRFENLEKLGVNKLIKLVDPSTESSVQLLAEGGRLLNGFINKLAIKSIDAKGLGKKAKVSFISRADTLSVVETNALGMGATVLFVNKDHAIQVLATFEDGTQQELKLPEIVTSGHAIVVNNQNDKRLFAQVNTSSDLVTGKDLYFVVQHLGNVLFVSKQKLNKEELVFNVDKKLLPSGVITLSILGENMQPILERPIFNYNQSSRLVSDVRLDHQEYGTRQKVSVDLNVGSTTDSMRIGAFSASVLNLSKIKDDIFSAPNILSSLLLSADLQGYIESPGYYFQKETIKTQELDYLMLTQGWRKYDWSKIDSTLTYDHEVEKSLSISGYTKRLGREKPFPNATVQMISTKNYMDFLDTTSNEEGYFEFDNLLFPDSVKFIITAKDAKGKNNIDIVFNAFEGHPVGANRNVFEEKSDVNAAFIDQIADANRYFSELENIGLKDKAFTIEEVVVRRSQKKKVAENSRNLNGPGNADQVITAEDLSTCITLEMCLVGRLTGVIWQNGIPYNTRGNVPMQVVLDGMFIEADQISMINVSDVESVEVLRNINYTAIYGFNGAGGLLIITSKTGASAMRNYVPKGILTILPQGVHLAKEFYKPTYEVAEESKIGLDLRTTIHWEPSIVTNEEGNASFNFYTADEKGTYLMIIEGLDLNGRILRKEVNIEVK